jgi:spermidine/putrescine transport system permease protein
MSKIFRHLYTAFIYFCLYLPIAIVIIFSFNTAQHSLIWKGFTFGWYQELFQDTSLLLVGLHSFIIGVLAASLATILGTIAAVSIYRYRFFGKNFLHGLLFVLVLSPEIVMGISLLLLYTAFKIPLGFWSLLLAHTTLCMPFVAITVYGRITTLDRELFEAARDLGASDFTTFKKIIVPLLIPSIVGGWLLSFTLSLDDVITSYFVSGPSFEILPLRIYSMVKLGIKPEINALCTLLLTMTLLIITIAAQLMFRKKRKK